MKEENNSIKLKMFLKNNAKPLILMYKQNETEHSQSCYLVSLKL